MILDNNSFFRNKRYRKLIIATLSTLLIGSMIYKHLEGWSWVDAIYFSVITLTTVGYGDLSPQTDLGKIFTIIYVITGVSLMFSFINALYQHRVNSSKKLTKKDN